jgi:UDP-N-acetylmuramyl-tripeptide synthetase
MQSLSKPQVAAQWLQQHVTGTLLADSRKIRAGDGFLAWPGAAADAREHVAEALKQGAKACLVEAQGIESFGFTDAAIATYLGLKAASGPIAAAFFEHPSNQMDVMAVTGTNGKTSTCWWLAQALSALPAPHTRACARVGTLGILGPNQSGQTSGLTTPDPVLLQQALRGFVQSGVRACALEASSIGLAERRLDGTRIHTAIFTNFTQDHLDYHGSMQAYWQAKRALFDWPGLQAVVINTDDEKGSALAGQLAASDLDIWTVSMQTQARLMAQDMLETEQGLQCQIREGGQIQPLATRLHGAYNLANLLCVIAAMRSLGVPLDLAVGACTLLAPVPGRMETIDRPAQPLVVVDYAHTPDALSQVLQALRPLARARQGRLWCVFGCGGERDAVKRPMMGAVAAKHADAVVLTSDNPRGEKPEQIISQILLGLEGHSGVQVQSDRALAIAQTLKNAQSQDVVLIAGKGHETEQDVAGQRFAFSDRLHALQALALRSAGALAKEVA